MGSGKTSKEDFRICIFISAIDSDKLVRQAISLGAEVLSMAKPIQGSLLERIHQMLKQETPTKEAAKPKASGAEGNPFEELKAKFPFCSVVMGISASIKGYHFIRKAVMMAVENQDGWSALRRGCIPILPSSIKQPQARWSVPFAMRLKASGKRTGHRFISRLQAICRPKSPQMGSSLPPCRNIFALRKKENRKKSAENK